MCWQLRAMCRRHNKPCVTLPAGYNASSVAHAVLEQISGKLGVLTGS